MSVVPVKPSSTSMCRPGTISNHFTGSGISFLSSALRSFSSCVSAFSSWMFSSVGFVPIRFTFSCTSSYCFSSASRLAYSSVSSASSFSVSVAPPSFFLSSWPSRDCFVFSVSRPW